MILTVVLVVAAFAGTCTSQNCEGTHPNEPQNVQVNTCGGAVVGQTGRIEYFMNEVRPAGERCAWILRANRQSSVRFRVGGSGLSVGQFLFVITMDTNSTSEATYTHAIPPGQINWVSVNYPVVYIIFNSNSATARGFVLEFEGTGTEVSPLIKYYHYDLPIKEPRKREIQFPPQDCGTMYPPNSIVTISNTHLTTDHDKDLPRTHMRFDEMEIADDVFNAFYSDRSETQTWVRLKTCCNPIQEINPGSWLSIPLTLITFKSGPSLEGGGFKFQWTVSQSIDPPEASLRFTIRARALPEPRIVKVAHVKKQLSDGKWAPTEITEESRPPPGDPNWTKEFEIAYKQGAAQILLIEIWNIQAHAYGTAYFVLDICNTITTCQTELDNGKGTVELHFMTSKI